MNPRGGGGVGEDLLEEMLPFPTRLRGFLKGLDSYKTFEELQADLAINGSREAGNVRG